MNLIDKKHSRDQLSHSLVNVAIYYLIYLRSQLFSDFCFFGFHYLAHQAHEVIATLRPGVGHVQVMQSDILHDLLFLVDISFG